MTSLIVRKNKSCYVRVRFFGKILDQILKYPKRIFFVSLLSRTNQDHLNHGASKGNEESLPRGDSSVPLTHYDPSDLAINLHKRETRNSFLDLRIQSWIFPKKRALTPLYFYCVSFRPRLVSEYEMPSVETKICFVTSKETQQMKLRLRASDYHAFCVSDWLKTCA